MADLTGWARCAQLLPPASPAWRARASLTCIGRAPAAWHHSLFLNVTGSYDYDNSENTFAPASFALYAQFLDQADTREALHVRNTPFGANSSDAEKALQSDFMRCSPAKLPLTCKAAARRHARRHAHRHVTYIH